MIANNFHKIQNFRQISDLFKIVFANLIEKATHVTIFWNLARNLEKIHQKFVEKNAKFELFPIELMKFINSIAKKNWRCLTKKLRSPRRIPRERCKGVLCVNLGESFPTSIYLQKSASIQPRTSPLKFGGKFNSIFNRVLRREVEGACGG